MHLFPPELEIGPEEGFTPGKDIFGRREFGERLTRIVRALEDPTVLLLDGKWGTGKTTFVRMWLGELSKVRIPTIYFDAFANDYHEDAFLTIAGEIIARSEELEPKRKRAINAFKTGAVKVAKALGRASLKIGIRAGSAGLLDSDELASAGTELAKAVGDETAKAVDELLKERLESHRADQKAFDQFRKSLSELAALLASSISEAVPSTAKGEAPQRKLVFVIDELDRCRPSFALELLEKIKHFFAVPGVTFVLVSSLAQLETAVRFAYGDIDARTYLEKFYHLRILFPVGRLGRPDLGGASYLNYLLEKIPPGSTSYVTIIERFHRVHPISFRTLERIHAYLCITTISLPEKGSFLPQIIAVLCTMKVIDPALYEAARGGTLKFDQVDGLLRFSQWLDQNDYSQRDRVGQNTENWWRYVLGVLSDKKMLADLQNSSLAFNFHQPSDILRFYCDMIDGFSFPA